MNYANLPKQPYPTEAQAIRVSPIEGAMSRLDNSIAVLLDTAYSLSGPLSSILTPEPDCGEAINGSGSPIKPVTCQMDDQLTALAYRVDSADRFLTELKARIQL